MLGAGYGTILIVGMMSAVLVISFKAKLLVWDTRGIVSCGFLVPTSGNFCSGFHMLCFGDIDEEDTRGERGKMCCQMNTIMPKGTTQKD